MGKKKERMNFKEIGEFGFIDKIKDNCIVNENLVIKGIGDDCAVVQTENSENYLLITTDLLIEGVHFLLERIPFFDLGYKSLAVNISDISAMGGIPRHALISIAIPQNQKVDNIIELYDGMKEIARLYNIDLVGGDTSSSKSGLFIGITLIGEVKKDEIIYRRGSKIGDIIYVTSYLGDSAGGLDIILNHPNEINNKTYKSLLQAHFRPTPNVNEGRIIATSKIATSMIDISDGISSDLRHICNQSGVGAIIYEEKIPVSNTLKEYCNSYNLDYSKFTLSGGEDYILLFTLPASHAGYIENLFYNHFKKNLYKIGEICKESEISIIDYNRKEKKLEVYGWDHFS